MAHILVVEDDKSMNEILTETLIDEGHEVRNAFCAKDGVKLGRDGTVDLVITDVRLPDMDGVEALSQIEKLQPSARFIVITGYASADTPVRAIRLGVDDYLFKPFSLRYLLRSVDRVLNSEAKRNRNAALFGKLINRLAGGNDSRRDRKLEYLVFARQEAFRGLLVGTRSEYLSPTGALAVYTRLEELETDFRHLINCEGPPPVRVQGVTQRYTQILDWLSRLAPGEEVEVPEPELIPPEEFEPLYLALKNSELDLEDLLYAPLLRSTPDQRFETLPQLLELKKRIWLLA